MKLFVAALALAFITLGSSSARAADDDDLDDAPPKPSAPPPPPLKPTVDVHQAPTPDASLDYHQVIPRPTFTWMVLQLLPSPELAVGTHRVVDPAGNAEKETHTAFGLRWQLTPVLWSFGTHRSQTRWRFFVVDPMARHSGSLELSTSFEYIGGYVDRTLARPGLKVYLPVAQKGEYVSVSLGTNVYRYDSFRVAYDVGIYFLSGFFGFQVTVAPTHAPLAAIGTIRLRYF